MSYKNKISEKNRLLELGFSPSILDENLFINSDGMSVDVGAKEHPETSGDNVFKKNLRQFLKATGFKQSSANCDILFAEDGRIVKIGQKIGLWNNMRNLKSHDLKATKKKDYTKDQMYKRLISEGWKPSKHDNMLLICDDGRTCRFGKEKNTE